jgi:exopolyphosphatase/guanosine-5'-triphosphate,3'-diphosphate pyrophosphatase
LPELHEAWIDDLKRMQDVLGEIHDLDVLSETARSVGAFETPVQRVTWRNAIAGERLQRLAQYRSRMLARSKNSLWTNWRAGLPDGEALHRAVLRKFEIWSALRDPDRLHTENVLELSLRIFDFLRDEKLLKFPDVDGISPRDLLNIAVLGHEAGHAKAGKHHKAVVKVFDKLDVPPGWSPVHLHMVGLIARYHIGAPPNEAQRQYASLRKSARRVVDRLAGILRLADAVERQRDMASREVNIARNDGNIVISAAGVHDRTRQAERIASARHLLESVCGLPIVVRPM